MHAILVSSWRPVSPLLVSPLLTGAAAKLRAAAEGVIRFSLGASIIGVVSLKEVSRYIMRALADPYRGVVYKLYPELQNFYSWPKP